MMSLNGAHIERLGDRKNSGGYKYSDDKNFAFFEVTWQNVSGHYLIQKRHRERQLVSRFPPKTVYGPYPVAILEPETEVNDVDERCLQILKRSYELRRIFDELGNMAAVTGLQELVVN